MASNTELEDGWWKALPSLPDYTQYKQYSVYELEDVVFFKDADGKVHAKNKQDVYKYLVEQGFFEG